MFHKTRYANCDTLSAQKTCQGLAFTPKAKAVHYKF